MGKVPAHFKNALTRSGCSAISRFCFSSSSFAWSTGST